MVCVGKHTCPDPDDCVPAGDPRYDGFRITELWIVTAIDRVDDQEGLVGDPITGGLLLASDERRLEQYVKPMLERLKPHLHNTSIKHFVLKED